MAASEKELGDLHSLICRVLTVKAAKALDYMLNPPPAPENAEDVVFTMPPELTASEMTVAVALLKNNNITCTKSKVNALGELEAILARKQGKATDHDVATAMDDIDHRMSH